MAFRAEAAANAQPGNSGALQSLVSIPREPNYDNLRSEIINQPTFAVSCFKKRQVDKKNARQFFDTLGISKSDHEKIFKLRLL